MSGCASENKITKDLLRASSDNVMHEYHNTTMKQPKACVAFSGPPARRAVTGKSPSTGPSSGDG